MSHNPETIIKCPNCGYNAAYNYCAQCGQATHLHKDTFFGLIGHFLSHYFHYDSKFWQTLKLLWFKPGALTVAYIQKQRTRYIPPVSLYIFISAVFFFLFYHFTASDENLQKLMKLQVSDSVIRAKNNNATAEYLHLGGKEEAERQIKELHGIPKAEFDKKMAEMLALLAYFIHQIPKFLFFMIPFMALIYKSFFVRRKDALYSNHAVFSLHYHSFWFSINSLAYATHPFPKIDDWVKNIFLIIALVYLVIAQRKVYKISWGRSISYALIVGLIYLLVFFILFFLFTAYYAAKNPDFSA